MRLSKSNFDAFKHSDQKCVHSLLRRAREGLNEEERQLARIMFDHSEEYFDQFEFADALADREFDSEREVNPVFHVALHAVAEN